MVFFLVLAVVVVLVLLSLKFHKAKSVNQGVNEDEWLGNSSIFRTKIKMLSYNDALEASKQFIYKIAQVVAERFAVDQRQKVIEMGTRLIKAGVQYVHVVDVFSLSLEAKRSHVQAVAKDKVAQQSKPTVQSR